MLAAWLAVPTVTSLSRLPLLLARHTKHLSRIRSISCATDDHEWTVCGEDAFGEAGSERFYHHLSNVTSLDVPSDADDVVILSHLPALERLHCSRSFFRKAEKKGVTLTALRHLALDDASPEEVPPIHTSLHSLSLHYIFVDRAGAASSCVTSLSLTSICSDATGLMAHFPRLRHLELELHAEAEQLLSEVAAMRPMPELKVTIADSEYGYFAESLAALTNLTCLGLRCLPSVGSMTFPRLNHLVLSDDWLRSAPGAPPPLMAFRHTTLRRLTLQRVPRHGDAIEWVAQFLAATTTLTHLTIDWLHSAYFRAIEEHPSLELVRVTEEASLHVHRRLEDFKWTLRVCKVCHHFACTHASPRTHARHRLSRDRTLTRIYSSMIAHTKTSHTQTLCADHAGGSVRLRRSHSRLPNHWRTCVTCGGRRGSQRTSWTRRRRR